MARRRAHLDLAQPGLFGNRPKRPPRSKVDPDLEDSIKSHRRGLESVKRSYEPDLPGGHRQDLVFMMETRKGTHEERFRSELRSVDMTAVRSAHAPAPKPGRVWTVHASDPDFKKMKKKLDRRLRRRSPNMVDDITSIAPMDPESKVGPLLRAMPLDGSARIMVYIDTRRVGGPGAAGPEVIDGAEQFIIDLARGAGYGVYDRVRSRNTYVLLVGCDRGVLDGIKRHYLVSRVDRVSGFGLPEGWPEADGLRPVARPPRRTGVGILVMDSGVLRHPLLDPSLSGRHLGLPNVRERDDMAHGTSVAGCALYGSLAGMRPDEVLEPAFDIHSGKAFYDDGGRARLDPSRMPMSLVAECVRAAGRIRGCRVVNASFGEIHLDGRDWSRQPEFSVLIDDLAEEFPDTVFTVSMGNVERGRTPEFPGHLLDTGSDAARLVPPASSIHALSVGALQMIRGELAPSDITRTGPGFGGMIKPDMVEVGGGSKNPVPVLNPDFRQRPMTFNAGTSFSTPVVANHVARIVAKFPGMSRNMVIALILSSSRYPPTHEEFSGLLPRQGPETQDARCMRRFHTYGLGKPDIRDALSSDDNRVVLKHEGSIAPDTSQCFEIPVPERFAGEGGRRTITVSLAFDPAVDKNRADYFGTRLGFRMYRNRSPGEVEERLGAGSGMDPTDERARAIDGDEIKFNPGPSQRELSPHQKGYRILTTKYRMREGMPLVLVVRRSDKWKGGRKVQKYAVCVTLQHEQNIDLYQSVAAMSLAVQRAHARL